MRTGVEFPPNVRNCICTSLTMPSAYPQLRDNPASMEHANFIKLLTDCTPLGWSQTQQPRGTSAVRYQAKEEF